MVISKVCLGSSNLELPPEFPKPPNLLQYAVRKEVLSLVDTVLVLLVGNFVNSAMPLLSKDLSSGKNAEVYKRSPIFQCTAFPNQVHETAVQNATVFEKRWCNLLKPINLQHVSCKCSFLLSSS